MVEYYHELTDSLMRHAKDRKECGPCRKLVNKLIEEHGWTLEEACIGHRPGIKMGYGPNLTMQARKMLYERDRDQLLDSG